MLLVISALPNKTKLEKEEAQQLIDPVEFICFDLERIADCVRQTCSSWKGTRELFPYIIFHLPMKYLAFRTGHQRRTKLFY